jgi:hypothetical protein
MPPNPARKTTAVGDNMVQPTDYQVRSGSIVIPKKFYLQHAHALDWKKSFTLVIFGARLLNKSIDYDRRLNVPKLREMMRTGDVLRLEVADECLVIEKT